MGATLQCSFGVAPSTLVVLPVNRVLCEGPLAANIMDHVPLVNIMPFGMCTSPANPQVAAATAAALGVPTPMPCVPATAHAVDARRDDRAARQPAVARQRVDMHVRLGRRGRDRGSRHARDADSLTREER